MRTRNILCSEAVRAAVFLVSLFLALLTNEVFQSKSGSTIAVYCGMVETSRKAYERHFFVPQYIELLRIPVQSRQTHQNAPKESTYAMNFIFCVAPNAFSECTSR